jgi:hypothetical protein
MMRKEGIQFTIKFGVIKFIFLPPKVRFSFEKDLTH